MRGSRVGEAIGAVGVRFVLLAYWSATAVLARWCEGCEENGAESVRRKA